MIRLLNRKMYIPNREAYIGNDLDNHSETRIFQISRLDPSEPELKYLTFRLDIEYQDGEKNTALLDKEITDESINLIWSVVANDVAKGGTILIQIRATDYNGVLKWHSFKAPFYIEPVIDTAGQYTGNLTELEQMEVRIQAAIDAANTGEEERQTAETLRQEAEIARETAELSRQEAVNAVVQNAQAAVEVAESAAQKANDAVDGLDKAIADAEEAAKKANDAVEDAETRVNEAVEAANTAIDNANTAAKEVESTVNEANTAASNANTAAEKANTAAEGADQVASEANTVIESAEKAVEEAMAAADRANQAADNVESIIAGSGTVTETERQSWNAAYDNSHEHKNKSVLDNITEENVFKPDGKTIVLNEDGTISGADTVPVATTEMAGKVKPDGTSITVDKDGTIHGTDTVPIATEETAGKVKPDGSTTTVDEDGTLHAVNEGYKIVTVESYEQFLEMKEAGTLPEGDYYSTPETGTINDDTSSEYSTYSSKKIDELLENVTIASETVEYTLLADSWTGDAAPYSYDLTEEYPSDKYDIEVCPLAPTGYTDEQKQAMYYAMFWADPTDNIYYATQDKPTVDIPVILKVVGK